MPTFPHLTDTESVRREAEAQYGGLNDAAAFQQSWRAAQDPNVEAAALRHRNADETAKVQNDLSLAQAKVDEVHGEGTYTVLDAAVRGHALSCIVEDQYGRPQHLVLGWTDKWRDISPKGPDAEARVNAQSEAAKGRLGAEARAEVARMVKEATAEILAQVAEKFGGRMEEVTKIRDDALAKVTDDGDGSGPRQAGSPSSTEGNDTSETGAGKTAGSESKTSGGGSGGSSEGSWPRRHDDLDALADEHDVSFEDLGPRATIDEKIEKLEAAGVTPPED